MNQLNGRFYHPDLHHPVTIRLGQWGVPHITAQTREDLFFAQGFAHARDRLWQMEVNRRAAHGTLSELFGSTTLDTDRLSRTLGFTRLAEASMAALTDVARRDLMQYTAGVNAYLRSRERLPLEFTLVQHRPTPWELLDSLAYGRLQMWALTCGASSEMIQAWLVRTVGAEMAMELGMQYPEENPVTLPNGIELNKERLDTLIQTAVSPFMGKGSSDGAGRGSNGWVIGPEKSSTGHAILANDMHLPMGTPSLWHLQHLHSADGFQAAGFTQPGLPYVMVGHNAHLAWGATMAYTDCEDLFIEQMDPERPFFYRVDETWEEATVIRERIVVRGRQDHVETVLVTRHGPLVDQTPLASDQPAHHRVALCSVALEPGLTIDGFGQLNEATDWSSFVAATERIQAPNLNLIYADQKGNIGHTLTGRVPVRQQGNGTLPMPGWLSAYDWQGVIPFAEMPRALNPDRHYLVTANNKIMPDDYPHLLGHSWKNGYRAKRIEQLVEQTVANQTAVSPSDCLDFQMDVLHLPALQLIQALEPVTPPDPATRFCHEQLLTWDGHLHTESIPGTIFQLWVNFLARAILGPHLPEALENALLGKGAHPNFAPVSEFQGQWLVTLQALLDDPESSWLPANREGLLLDCLQQTAVYLHETVGVNSDAWRWGQFHTITFRHTLGIVPLLNQLFDVGPYAIGGDTYTVLQTGMAAKSLANDAVSVSSRMIVDLGDWDCVQVMHAPGQSGDRQSDHYADLAPLWQNGRLIPLLWSETAVKASTVQTIRLLPTL